MKPNQLRLSELVSGSKARQYRKTVASWGARDNQNSMTTLKFKLESPISSNFISFDIFKDAYNTIEGVGEGTLTHYLCSLLLSGFRIYPKSALADNFCNSTAYDNEGFKKACQKSLGVTFPKFIPSEIKVRLEKNVRSTNGKDNSFTVEVIENEYGKEWFKKPDPKKADLTLAQNALHDIAEALVHRFSSFNDLISHTTEGLIEVDKVLAKYGDFPSMSEMHKKANIVLPKNSVLAFDPNSQFVNSDTPWALHYCVANLLKHYEDSDGKRSDFVKEHLTTAVNSGLSWFFGEGLKFFQSHSIEEIAKAYGVPEKKYKAIAQLKRAADALGEQSLIGNGKGKPQSYAIYRSAFGGHIDSWVSNYINRLEELQKLFASLPNQLQLPRSLIAKECDFLVKNEIDRDSIQELCSGFDELCRQAQQSVLNLLGQGEDLVESDFQMIVRFTDMNNRLIAIRKQIQNLLVQADSDDASVYKGLAKQCESDWKAWDQLEVIPKLNQLTGGVANAQGELNDIAEMFPRLLTNQKNHFERIRAYALKHDCTMNILDSLVAREKNNLQKRPKIALKTTPTQLAMGRFLHQIGRLVRDGQNCANAQVIDWFKTLRIFENEKDFNLYFCNKKGSLYISPFSTKRHESYKLSSHVMDNPQVVIDSYAHLIERIASEVYATWEDREGQIKLVKHWYATQLSSLDIPLPSEIATLDLPKEYESVLSEDLRFELRKDCVSASTMQRIFNVYASLESGFMIMLRRERFFLRTKFSWVDNNVLLYRPKKTTWAIPHRYFETTQWKAIADLDVLQKQSDGLVDVEKTFDQIILMWEKHAKTLRPLLVQLPHDWCYQTPFTSEQSKGHDVVLALKKGDLKPVKVHEGKLLRLIGPSCLKSQVDKLLLSAENGTVSDMTLLIDQLVHQKVNKAGEVLLTDGGYTMTLAMPMSIPVPKSETQKPTFKRIVAIDQGEIGLAYAIFNLTDVGNAMAQPITTGTVRIPSIRRLIKSVRRYRKGGQSAQKFNQRFDSSMFTLRENVAGDVCGAIEGLMHRFNAFPVLEYQVKNLASGSKQLSLVYNMVNHRFTWSNVLAHKNERKSWWFETQMWEAPNNLIRLVPNPTSTDKLKKVGESWYKPLQLFPGTTVNASMTSRICSHCGRNVFEDIRALEQANVTKVSVVNGEVELAHGKIRLYKKPDKEARKVFRRRNENVPFNTLLDDQELKMDVFVKRVRDNLRRVHKSVQTKDTTQSQFFCPYADCDNHNVAVHADVNAAINIGRRLLLELIVDQD